MSKLFERLLTGKIYNCLLTSDNQFAYKKCSNTDACIFAFKEIIDIYNSLGSNVYCCFLDASRAFDRISHRVLFSKLVCRNVPLIFVRILAFWYKYQVMFVKWNNCLSESFTVTNGVRQGSCLSPYLFSVYVDFLSKKLNETKIGCKVNDVLLNHLFYADDLCILCPSSRGLQRLLNICHECGVELDILFNERKSKVMVFKSSTFRNCLVPTFIMGSCTLDICSSFTYLGHIITSDRKDNDDISRQCRSIYARGNMLVRNFSKCSVDVKLLLFKTYCTSLYTAQLWANYTQASLRKLSVAYHSILKMLLNLPRWYSNSMLFVNVGVPTFQELLRRYVFGFKSRIECSDNNLIACINERNLTYPSSLTQLWNKLLHI